MKQKDIALIIVVCFFSAIMSFVVSNMLIATPKSRQQKAEVVGKITDEFQQPNDKYFNANSVNPTQIIRIGDGQNPTPFNQ